MADQVKQEIASADCVFFDAPGCPFCRQAEAAMKSAGIPFKKVDIDGPGIGRAAIKAVCGKTSAPAVFIKGVYVGGCNDGTESWHGVMPMLKSGKFQEMLK
mmetsp:Transcript_1230/g.3768  ORF Transcript_1230/g.3768 Transcript_1230/m.3768 type:complete len:101 (+) Transcript_1230:76-378(+)